MSKDIVTAPSPKKSGADVSFFFEGHEPSVAVSDEPVSNTGNLGFEDNIILEIVQLLANTGRSFDLADATANILGCFGGLLIFYLILIIFQ